MMPREADLSSGSAADDHPNKLAAALREEPSYTAQISAAVAAWKYRGGDTALLLWSSAERRAT
jgi:hypothetical protein